MTDRYQRVLSSVPGMQWPGLPTQNGASLLALQFQLEQTQWWTPEQLRQHQFRQLGLLLHHAHDSVPFYRERLGAAGFRPGMEISDSWFAALPRLTRGDVQARGDALHSRNLPAAHAPVEQGRTSGSTGAPILFLTTAVTRLFWQAFNLRDHLWHRREFGLKLATIGPDRGVRDDRGVTVPHWAPLLAELFSNGPSSLLHSANTLNRQIEWLVEQDPDYLLAMTTNLLELAREMRRHGVRLPRLREARAYGETLHPEARRECKALLGVNVVDMYTCQEAGYLALQCPDHDHYHLQCESSIVEILDDSGRRCGDGEIGRVVITALHNYAMPLIRYEIGDYAEAGAPCPCGRGLPVMRRVMGRQRNLAVAADGRRFFPSFAAEEWAGIAPIRQIQLVQKSLQRIEVRVAGPRALEGGEERRLAETLLRTLGHPFEFTFVYLDTIPRAASGKYEDFICEIA